MSCWASWKKWGGVSFVWVLGEKEAYGIVRLVWLIYARSWVTILITPYPLQDIHVRGWGTLSETVTDYQLIFKNNEP